MIVGIFGNNRSGKTTLALHLKQNMMFKQVAFATKLKELVKRNMVMDDSWKEDPEPCSFSDSEYRIPSLYHLKWVERAFGTTMYLKYLELIKGETEKYKVYRKTLEFVGTECCRNRIDNNIWTTLMEYHLINNIDNNIVIDDIRFPNEYDALKRRGAVFIKVTSPWEEPPGLHESQIHVERFIPDYTIINDYTDKPLEELEELVGSLLDHSNFK